MGAFITNENKIYNFLNNDSLNSQLVLASQETMKVHTVKSGEHLSTIAKRYGCTVADIKQWNSITGSTVKPGKKLTIYVYGKKPATTGATTSASASTNTTTKSQGGYKLYTVKKGDTLFKIAQTNKTTVDELKRLNKFGAKFTLMPGQKIKVGTN
jgi:LysM repeat protein